MAQTVLLTGSAGFIGSHLLRLILTESQHRVISLDCLNYASDTDTIEDLLNHPRHEFVKGNICDEALVNRLVKNCDGIIHMAAESHVDRSIHSATPFIRTNVFGTQVLLDAAVKHGKKRFLYVSTDEVYGDLSGEGLFDETMPINPSSPYSASKAAADLMVQAWQRTYDLPTVVTRCTNNLGTHQHPEKLIPRLILKAVHGQPLPIYGHGNHVRDWIDVRDHVRALWWAYTEAPSGFVVNIGAQQEISNLALAQKILDLIPDSPSTIEHVSDRPGHDFRYANCTNKLKKHANWKPQHGLNDSLKTLIQWYRENPQWWAPRWTESE
jgi:dTDP-glucose 4,6-dehydratase